MNVKCGRIGLVLGLLISTALSFPAWADSEASAAGNIRACFIDLQEVLRNFPEYAQAKETLEGWAKDKQKLVAEKERQIQKLDSDLKKSQLRSEDSKKEMESEFKKELGVYQDMVKQLQAELSDKEDELLSPVKEVLSKAIEDVSKAKGFNVVYDAAAPGGRPILYVDDSLDITEAVSAKMKDWASEKDKKADKKK